MNKTYSSKQRVGDSTLMVLGGGGVVQVASLRRQISINCLMSETSLGMVSR